MPPWVELRRDAREAIVQDEPAAPPCLGGEVKRVVAIDARRRAKSVTPAPPADAGGAGGRPRQ